MSAPARMTDPSTSHVARPSAARRAQLKDLVLHQHLRYVGAGLTDAELCALLPDETPGSVVKRRGELVADGRLADSGERRAVPRTGRAAIVWRVVR